jgi:hypothetical protein
MEKYIGTLFQTIMDNTQSEELYSKYKIRKITQALEWYKDQIKDL